MDNKTDNMTIVSEENKDDISVANKTDYNANGKSFSGFIKSINFKHIVVLVVVFMLGVFVGNLGDSSTKVSEVTEDVVSKTEMTDEDKAIEMFLNHRMYNGYTDTVGEVLEAICQKTKYEITCKPAVSGEEGAFRIVVSGDFQVQPNNSYTNKFILAYNINILTNDFALENDAYQSDNMIWGYWVNTGAVNRYHQYN